MAFRFFRKRQKMVIIIMVALMVSFLIGIQGFNMFCDVKGGKATVGTMAGETVKAEELRQANSDITLLRDYLELGQNFQRHTAIQFLTLIALNEGRGRAPYAYAMLLREARDAGIEVAPAEVDAFMQQVKTAAELESLRNKIQGQSGGLAFRDLEEAVGRWLMIFRHFESVAATSGASEMETRALFRDLNEKIGLRVVKVPASKYVAGVKAPTDAQIAEHFAAFRDRQPDQITDDNPFGFGYKQPDRAAVSYLAIRSDVIRRVSRPSDRVIMDHYTDNKAAYTKDVWLEGGAVAAKFVSALAEGDADAADQLIKPGSDAAKKLATLRKVISDGAVTLEQALSGANQTVVLAVSSPVRTGGAQFGPVVVELAKAPAGWRVEKYDVQTATDAAQAEADFRKKHADVQPVPKNVIQKTYSEAEGDIIERFSREVVASRMDAVANTVSAMLTRAAQRGELPADDPYGWVVSRMTRPADEALQRPVDAERVRSIQAMPLDEAIKKLAAAANVGTICYPWGEHGAISIDPGIRVTLVVQPGTAITLGQALAQIDAQVPALSGQTTGPTTQPATQPATRPATQPATRPTTQPAGPRLKWKTCRGFQIGGRDVLFAVEGPGGLDLLPVQAGQTGLLEQSALGMHEVLGLCSTSPDGRGGDRLVDAAFSAKEFGQDDKEGQSARAEVGKEGARMYAPGEMGGAQMVLWQLRKVEPAYAPDSPDAVGGLKAKVIAGVKQRQAYDQALKVARDLADAPEGLDLASEAKARGLTSVDTDLFARKAHVNVRRQNLIYAQYFRRPDWILRAMIDRPHALNPSSVSEVNLRTDEEREKFLEQVFALVPASGEATTKPAASGKKLVVPLPGEKAVAVVQRVQYRPPVESEYLQGDNLRAGRAELMQILFDIQQWQVTSDWFNWDKIAERVDFKDKEPEKTSDEEEND